MNVVTFSGDGLGDFESKLADELSQDFKPSLAILFSSIQQPYQKIVERLSENGLQVIGATTAGEITEEGALEYSFCVMLLEIDPDKFTILIENQGNRETSEVSRLLRLKAEKQFSNPAMILLTSGIETNGDEVVRGLTEGFENRIPIYGGMAGDDATMNGTVVFNHEEQTDQGIVSLVFDGDRIAMSGLASSGWEAVGVAKTVTKSEGNVVYTIDGEPALNVFNKYFGLSDDLDNQVNVIESLGAQYPLQILRENGSSILRAPLVGNGENGSMVFAGEVPQGSEVKFSISPGIQIADQAVSELERLKVQQPDADALLLFSCMARHLALGPLVEDEIRGMQKKWGKPLVGLFTYGEIGSFELDTCEFHNETCCLVALKDRD